MSNTIIKAPIAETITDAHGFTKIQANETVNSLIETIKRTLESGEDVISGFEKFCVR